MRKAEFASMFYVDHGQNKGKPVVVMQQCDCLTQH